MQIFGLVYISGRFRTSRTSRFFLSTETFCFDVDCNGEGVSKVMEPFSRSSSS